MRNGLGSPLYCASSSVKKKEITQPFKTRSDEESYPGWFWEMPHSEKYLFAVGFSKTYSHPKSSEQKATEDGIENLARSLSIGIKGERGLLRGGGQTFSKNNFQEEIPTSALAFVKKHHQVVATHTSKSYTFLLLCLGEGNAATLSAPAFATVAPKKPIWMRYGNAV